MYLAASEQLGFTTNGTQRMNIQNSSVTATVPFFAPTGSAADPTFAFTSDPDTGMYSVGGNVLGFSTNSINRLSIQDDALVSTVEIRNADGTVSSPGYTFSGDQNTGMYRISSDTIGFSAGNNKVLELNDNGYSAPTQDTYIVRASSTQNVSNNTVTTFTNWATATIDNGNITEASGVFTLGTTGVYVVAYAGSYSSNTTNGRIWRLVDGSGTRWAETRTRGVNSGFSSNQSGEAVIYSDGTETIKLELFQNSGSTLAADAQMTITRTS